MNEVYAFLIDCDGISGVHGLLDPVGYSIVRYCVVRRDIWLQGRRNFSAREQIFQWLRGAPLYPISECLRRGRKLSGRWFEFSCLRGLFELESRRRDSACAKEVVQHELYYCRSQYLTGKKTITGDRVANTPIFRFSMGNVILALKVERLVNAFDSFSVFVFK